MTTSGRPWTDNAAPTGRWPALQLDQLWRHRELLWFFAQRDVKVRYKQALLGVAWAGLQPLLGALAFTVLFHELAAIDIGERSYFAFALVGFSVWAYFSATVATGTSSLLANAELLTKVAFPRIVAPLSTLLPALIDLAVGIALALAVSTATGAGPSPAGVLAALVPGLVLLVVAVTGPVLLFSTSVVRYRDVSVVVGFGLQLLLFATPVGYPPELVPEGWRPVLYANPVAGCLGLLRHALIGTPLPPAAHLALSAGVAGALALAGFAHFRRHEREFADII